MGAKVSTVDREQLIISAMAIAKEEARKLAPRCHTSFDDLVSEGMIAVIENADQALMPEITNPTGYVKIMIRCRMYRYVREHDSLIRTPRSRHVSSRIYPASLDVLCGEVDVDGGALVDTVVAEVDHDAILLAALHEAFDQLSDIQRWAVLERFNGGAITKVRAYRSFCKELGLSAKATMELVDDALAFLRRELVVEVG